MFEYGSHSNSVLLAEYGFRDTSGCPPSATRIQANGAEQHVKESAIQNLRYGEVDLGTIVDKLWSCYDSANHKIGDDIMAAPYLTAQRQLKEDILRAIGCFRYVVWLSGRDFPLASSI